MVKRGMVVCVAMAAAFLTACAQDQKSDRYMEKPTAVEMRTALKDLLAREPKYSIPEFELSLAQSPAVQVHGLTRIGSFDCDPNGLSFDATFSAPNLTMQELEGRFELDARHMWKAVVLRSAITRAHELSPRPDWYHQDDVYSWTRKESD